jgi:hypothetical protein
MSCIEYMTVTVTKLTDVELLRKAAAFTTGRDCHMTLATAYRNQHSIIRTQQFFIELRDIPLFVASQLVRSHVGVQFFQRSKRTDRGGADFRQVCAELAHKVRRIPYITLNRANSREEISNRIAVLPETFDRDAPTDLAFICNAEFIINTSHKRLCTQASAATRYVWQKIVAQLYDIDPDLYDHCVPQCIYRGGICPEPHSCGYNKSAIGAPKLKHYVQLMQPK